MKRWMIGVPLALALVLSAASALAEGPDGSRRAMEIDRERLIRAVTETFDRADRDGDGVLRGDERRTFGRMIREERRERLERRQERFEAGRERSREWRRTAGGS